MKNENLENINLEKACSFLEKMSTQEIEELELKDYVIRVYEMMIQRLYTEVVSGRKRVSMVQEEYEGTRGCGNEHTAAFYQLDGAEYSLRCTENSLKNYQNRLNDLKENISNLTQLIT